MKKMIGEMYKIMRHRMTIEQIAKIIEMRKEGYSLNYLGRYFGKDHTTILYHCQRAKLSIGISHKKVINGPKFRKWPETFSYDIYTDETGEKLNPGKNYADYVKEEENRKWKKRKDNALIL